jgi:hypothetical protein
MRMLWTRASNRYVGRQHICLWVTDKRAEPLRRFRRRHGPQSFSYRRTVFWAGFLFRPKPPCEFLRNKPGSAGRETPDDHPDSCDAQVRSTERGGSRLQPSPGCASWTHPFPAFADHGEGGRQRSRPAFPTGIPRGHDGFTNDLDQIPRAGASTKPKRRSQDFQPSRTRPPPRESSRGLARKLNSPASPISQPFRSRRRSSQPRWASCC